MVYKILISFLFYCLLPQCIIAQEGHPKFSIGFESQLLIGGEFNASYDFLLGARGTYLLKKKGDFEFFSTIGLAIDIANTDSRLLAVDAQLGSFWNFNKRLALLGSLGGQYMHESHSFLLAERQQNWQKSTLGVTGHLGLRWQFSDSFNSVLFLKQTNLTYTSIGLGLNYSF